MKAGFGTIFRVMRTRGVRSGSNEGGLIKKVGKKPVYFLLVWFLIEEKSCNLNGPLLAVVGLLPPNYEFWRYCPCPPHNSWVLSIISDSSPASGSFEKPGGKVQTAPASGNAMVIENLHLRRRPDDFFAFIEQQN